MFRKLSEGIRPTWIKTTELNGSSHMAFVDTFWFARYFACVKPNWTKGKMQMSWNTSTDSDHMNRTTGVKTP